LCDKNCDETCTKDCQKCGSKDGYYGNKYMLAMSSPSIKLTTKAIISQHPTEKITTQYSTVSTSTSTTTSSTPISTSTSTSTIDYFKNVDSRLTNVFKTFYPNLNLQEVALYSLNLTVFFLFFILFF